MMPVNGHRNPFSTRGPAELKLIETSGWREFPPRLPEQPIFYPVLNKEYAVQIANDWNVKESGSGFVTQFAITADVFAKYKVETVGGSPAQPDERESDLRQAVHPCPLAPPPAPRGRPGDRASS